VTGQPVAVDDDVELEVQPHRLGHRLTPRNPLSVNDNVVHRHGLARARGSSFEGAVAVGERVDDGQ
jgi:hypothetical protein